MVPFSFDPFSSYAFANSQEPANKYGLAQIWLEPAERIAAIKPFAPFDIRQASSREQTAYWVSFAYRLRMEGLVIAIPLLEALQDVASQRMLRALLASPPSARDFRQRVKPYREQVLREESARFAMIRKAALAVFRGRDARAVLAGLTDEERLLAQARSDELWQQEKERPPPHSTPSPSFHVPARASHVELAALFHFLDRAFREGEQIWSVECYIDFGDGTVSPYAEPFLDYALSQAGHNYRAAAMVSANLRQREKALLHALANRLDALTAYFVELLNDETSPEHLLSRLNSYWPEDAFANARQLRDQGEGEATR
ncbi:hypothetical protein [Propionivibrio sp.]|uniref:hypothetical protein n=1 Tax=Propionivibrio sp. TaxID=2212460 RepID=UPI003BF13622